MQYFPPRTVIASKHRYPSQASSRVGVAKQVQGLVRELERVKGIEPSS